MIFENNLIKCNLISYMVKNQSHLVSLTLVLNGVKLETLLTTNMNTSFLFSHKLLYVMEYKSFQKNYVFHLFEVVQVQVSMSK